MVDVGGRVVEKGQRECGGGVEFVDADVEVVQVAWIPLEEVSDLLRYPDERRLVGMVPGLLALPER